MILPVGSQTGQAAGRLWDNENSAALPGFRNKGGMDSNSLEGLSGLITRPSTLNGREERILLDRFLFLCEEFPEMPERDNIP